MWSPSTQGGLLPWERGREGMHPVLGSRSDEPAWPHDPGQSQAPGSRASCHQGEADDVEGPCCTAQDGRSRSVPGVCKVHSQLTAGHNPMLCWEAKAGSHGSWDLFASKRHASDPSASCTGRTMRTQQLRVLDLRSLDVFPGHLTLAESRWLVDMPSNKR